MVTENEARIWRWYRFRLYGTRRRRFFRSPRWDGSILVPLSMLDRPLLVCGLPLGLSPNHSALSKSAEYSAHSILGSGAGFSLSLGHMTRPLTISRASGSRPL